MQNTLKIARNLPSVPRLNVRSMIRPGITEGHDGSALRVLFVPSTLGVLLRSGLKRSPTILLRATLVQQMRAVESKRAAIGQQIGHAFALENYCRASLSRTMGRLPTGFWASSYQYYTGRSVTSSGDHETVLVYQHLGLGNPWSPWVFSEKTENDPYRHYGLNTRAEDSEYTSCARSTQAACPVGEWETH